jgi:AcrR family transcriptional regulator
MRATAYDERLDRLLATAARVFADRGYHATTMRDLARVTGMSLAGMYYYVGSKDELLYRIQERCFEQVLAGARAAVSQGTTPADRIARFIRHHVVFFARHMSEMKVLSHEAESLSGPRREKITRLKRRYVELLSRLIGQLDEEGSGWPEPRIAAYALFGMMNWIYTWYDPTGPVSPDNLAGHFARLFLTGAAANPSAAVHAHGGAAATAAAVAQGGF